jgi:hypothetical protein
MCILLIWLSAWFAATPEKPAVKINHVAFDELKTGHNTMSQKGMLLRTVDIMKLTVDGSLCLKSPLSVFFPVKASANTKMPGLYSWDASLQAWVKCSAIPVTFVRAGGISYYSAELLCSGMYGLFYEEKSTIKTLVSVPDGWKIYSLKYTQDNTKLIFDWADRIGANEVVVPYAAVSPIASLQLTVADKSGIKKQCTFRVGKLIKRSDDPSVPNRIELSKSLLLSPDFLTSK